MDASLVLREDKAGEENKKTGGKQNKRHHKKETQKTQIQ